MDDTLKPDRSVVGVLCTEGSPTGDGRKIDTNSLRWTLPQPLRWVKEDFGAHNGAVVVGAIEKITRTETGELAYAGQIFETAAGDECYAEMFARYSSSGLKFGISVDLDDVVVEDEGDTMVVKEARLRGATLCDIPAYDTAYTMLATQVAAQALVAAAPRHGLPGEWFEDPRFTGPTPLTITDDGRVYGHAALWSTCHTGYADMCITAPRSRSNYAYFKTGVVITTEGTKDVGQITMSTGHASARLSAGPAADHYDNTGAATADVAAGEDKFGLWLAGAVREGVTPAQIAEMRAAAVSGDWRTIDGSLELVAMLSVNVPGFPVPRMRAMVASGEVTSLVASAVFESEENVEEQSTEMAPEAVLEAVAPEPVEEAPEVLAEESVEDQPDAAEAEEVPAEVVEDGEVDYGAQISEMKDMLAQALAEIAALRAGPLLPKEEEEETEEEEDAEEGEPAPAVEHSQDDILAALDALVNGKKDVNALLAELDAKVG